MEDWKNTEVKPVPNTNSSLPFLSSQYENLNLQQIHSLGKIGLGVQNITDTTDFSQGPLQASTQELDLAIQGDGFFQVMTPNGMRYTRDGRFQKDSAGNMINADGYKVMDENGQPIVLGSGSISVGNDGVISEDNARVAKLTIMSFSNPRASLVHDSDNYYLASTSPDGTSVGRISQNYVEGSNVDIADAMTQMISIGRSYEAAQQLVTVQDTLLGRAIQQLGKV
jgi:flagellar basal body rod protein FlgG